MLSRDTYTADGRHLGELRPVPSVSLLAFIKSDRPPHRGLKMRPDSPTSPRRPSQKALHDSDNGSGAAKGHIKHEAPGDDLNHGQSQKALHGSDNGSGAAKGHIKHEANERLKGV